MIFFKNRSLFFAVLWFPALPYLLNHHAIFLNSPFVYPKKPQKRISVLSSFCFKSSRRVRINTLTEELFHHTDLLWLKRDVCQIPFCTAAEQSDADSFPDEESPQRWLERQHGSRKAASKTAAHAWSPFCFCGSEQSFKHTSLPVQKLSARASVGQQQI